MSHCFQLAALGWAKLSFLYVHVALIEENWDKKPAWKYPNEIITLRCMCTFICLPFQCQRVVLVRIQACILKAGYNGTQDPDMENRACDSPTQSFFFLNASDQTDRAHIWKKDRHECATRDAWIAGALCIERKDKKWGGGLNPFQISANIRLQWPTLFLTYQICIVSPRVRRFTSPRICCDLLGQQFQQIL